MALFLVAAWGGAQNAVAGGGSFFTFPMLLFAGVPPIEANATSTVALWPGSVASAFGFREELRLERRTLVLLGVVSALGGLLGALLLLLTPEKAFSALIPWLLLAATLTFAFGPALTRRLRDRAPHDQPRLTWPFVLAQLGVAVYGGYFGGGIGIMMLAAFSAMGMEDLHAMNGLKAILGALINGVAIVAFIVAGKVVWPLALLMVAGSVVGGYGGARLSKRVDPKALRAFIIAVGSLLSLYFFAKQLGLLPTWL
ncbi:MAG: uncharacterized protein QOE90_887 [Thermoplasmata archaeon]|nr:uncharacterized protein [Thermoplasmata archaeon]